MSSSELRSARGPETVAAVRHVSPRKLMSLVVLASWGVLFWFLLASGREALYLSSRTDWVVPVGAIITTAALLGRLPSLWAGKPETLTSKEAAGSALLVLPVVAILALPPASLGTFAAGRRSSLVNGGFVSSAEDIVNGPLTLVDVGGALRSRDAMRALSARAGAHVSFIGFVNRDEATPADEFTLTRFLITCCVADALSIEVRVVGAPPGRFAKDQWVRVDGALYPLTHEVVVDASSITAVDKPSRPYLNP